MSNSLANIDVSAIQGFEDVNEQLALFRRTYHANLTDDEFQLMQTEARYRGLDVFKKEFAAIAFGKDKYRTVAFFPTIHGLRKLALESGALDGMVKQWCGPDGAWRDIWLDTKPPAGARCSVFVRGSARPFVGIATYNERKRTRWDDTKKEHVLMQPWKDQPAHMLAKCAEADALRASGLISDVRLPQAVLNSQAFLAEPDEVLSLDEGETDDLTLEQRSNANRNAHRLAQLESSNAHQLVRETVQAVNPERTSLSEASTYELNKAAEVIEVFGANAPLVISGESVEVAVDSDTGEIFQPPTEREEFKILAREVLEAEGASGWKRLIPLAGDDVDKWEVLICEVAPLGKARTLRNEFIKACSPGTRADPEILERANAMLEKRENAEISALASSKTFHGTAGGGNLSK